MKTLLAVLLLLVTTGVFGQACTNDGTGNVCTPTFYGKWVLLNHASDIGSGDIGCFLYKQVHFATGALTITMTNPGTAPTCGETGRTQAAQAYLSGGMISVATFTPTAACSTNGNCIQCSSGTCTIQASLKVGKGWPAFWLLGGNGLLSASTGCQYQTAYNTFDNTGNCNWSQDSGSPGDSAETDIMEFVEPTYTDTNQNLFSNGATNLGSSQTITDGSANFHVYALHWSSSSLTYAVDGTASSTHYTSNVPQNPQFILLENRIQTGAGKVPGSFPQVMTMQYVQVCDGTTCTSPGTSGGNTVFFDNFTPLPSGGRKVMF